LLGAAGLTVLFVQPGSSENLGETSVPVRMDLFVAGTLGYGMYRIPGIAVTPKGALLAYAEARKTSGSDWDGIDLVLRRSQDGGVTWSAQEVIGRLAGPIAKNPVAPAKRPDAADAITYNNPIAIADRKAGLVHFLYCVEYMRVFYARSTDDGRTFSPPVEITGAFEKFRTVYPWKVLATGPGHGIQLRNGRLLVPVWLSTAEGGNAHRPSVVATISSDDHGATWKGGEIAVPNTGEIVNPSETAAEQLADGRVMLNVRTESKAHRRLIVLSADGATRWSAPRYQEELVEPICFGSLVRYGRPNRRGPNLLLFVNPDNLLRGEAPGEPGRSRDRKNLTVHLSEDDGATWKVKRVIDPGWSGYADINVGPEGAIYCLYERGQADQKQLRIAALSLVRFNLAWLRAGAAGGAGRK
jgi:sialidase-1